MEKVKFDYDEESDSLFLYKEGETVRGSAEIGDFVLDFASNSRKVVGLEIINATENLRKALSDKITKDVLKNMRGAMLRTEIKQNTLYVIYGIASVIKHRKIEEKSMLPVMVNA